MDKKTYNELMAKGADKGLTQKQYDELLDFAKAKKIKRPSVEWVRVKAVKEPKVKEPKAKCSPSLHGSDETCEKDSRSNGVCPAHYSRLVYRQNEVNAEKVRQASRDYAERQRVAKAEQAAAAK